MAKTSGHFYQSSLRSNRNELAHRLRLSGACGSMASMDLGAGRNDELDLDDGEGQTSSSALSLDEQLTLDDLTGDSLPRRHRGRLVVALCLIVGLAALAGAEAGSLSRPAVQVKPPLTTTGSTTPSQISTQVAKRLQAVVATDLPGIVTIVAVSQGVEELGTGWAIDSRGDFITNNHVVQAGQSFQVVVASGAEYPAAVVNTDAKLDLAEVHMTGLSETPLPLDSTLPVLGQPVVVLAAEGATGHKPVTEATIDGLDENTTASNAGVDDLMHYHDLLGISAKIYPGDSGGPVLTSGGQVVGILTLAAKTGSGAYAIPIDEVEAEISAWLKN
jgi:putative serine protease PepD